jgi:hypothetical protein
MLRSLFNQLFGNNLKSNTKPIVLYLLLTFVTAFFPSLNIPAQQKTDRGTRRRFLSARRGAEEARSCRRSQAFTERPSQRFRTTDRLRETQFGTAHGCGAA